MLLEKGVANLVGKCDQLLLQVTPLGKYGGKGTEIGILISPPWVELISKT